MYKIEKIEDGKLFDEALLEEILEKAHHRCEICGKPLTNEDMLVGTFETYGKLPLCEECSKLNFDGYLIHDFYRYLGLNTLADLRAYEQECFYNKEKMDYNHWLKEGELVVNVPVVPEDGGAPVEEEVVIRRATYEDLNTIRKYFEDSLHAQDAVKYKEGEIEEAVLKNVTFMYLTGCFYVIYNTKNELVGAFSTHLSREMAGVDYLPVIKNLDCNPRYISALSYGVSEVVKQIRSITNSLGMYVILLVRKENEVVNMAIRELFKVSSKRVMSHSEMNMYFAAFAKTKSIDFNKPGPGQITKMLKAQARCYEHMTKQRDADMEKYLPEKFVSELRGGKSGK